VLIYPEELRLSLPQIGMVVGLVSLTFFFVALLLAFGLRMDAHPEWHRFDVPDLLWVGTGTLLLSSLAVELAARSLRRALVAVYRSRLLGALFLACVFLVIQGVSAADLLSQGVAIAGNPRGSAFYIFMSIHGVHLLAGVAWLSWLWLVSKRLFVESTEQSLRRHRRILSAAALFWHFMGTLWMVMFWFLRRWATGA
jgi:cytochrome c oxidase subunit III